MKIYDDEETVIRRPVAPVEAEDLPQLFQRVSKSVVVVRAHGRWGALGGVGDRGGEVGAEIVIGIEDDGDRAGAGDTRGAGDGCSGHGKLHQLGYKRVAEWGDGWLPTGMSVDKIQQGWATITDLAQKKGRDPKSLTLIVFGAPGQFRAREDLVEKVLARLHAGPERGIVRAEVVVEEEEERVRKPLVIPLGNLARRRESTSAAQAG